MAKNLVLWIIIAMVLMFVFSNFSEQHAPQRLEYSEFVREVDAGQVRSVLVDGYTIYGEKTSNERFETIRPSLDDPHLMDNC